MLRLAPTGLPRILPEPDRDPLAILCGGIEQQLFDVARVGARPHHIQYPIAAAAIAAELDANDSIRVVELGFFGDGEIPITNDVEIRRSLVYNARPLSFEIQSSGGPDLPIAGEQRRF
jgi:hypothetical protein